MAGLVIYGLSLCAAALSVFFFVSQRGLCHAEVVLCLKNGHELQHCYEKLAKEKSAQHAFLSVRIWHFKVTIDRYKHSSMIRMAIHMLEDASNWVGKEFVHFLSGLVSAVLQTDKEYAHFVVDSLAPSCQLSINEGLAEYFSKNYQKEMGQLIPLKSLGSSLSWVSRERFRLPYRESYSAVDYLKRKARLLSEKGVPPVPLRKG